MIRLPGSRPRPACPRPAATPGTGGRRGLAVLAVAVLGVAFLAACGDLGDLHHGGAPWETHDGDTAVEGSVAGSADSAASATSAPAAARLPDQSSASSSAAVPGAERWTADLATVAVELPGREGEFRVTARAGALRHAPCAQCHGDGAAIPGATIPGTGIPGTGMPGAGRPRRAHWNVARPHGEAGELTCATCHAADGTLTTLAGEPVDFDHSYKLCGTCHFQQVRDWAGGAHGKRVEAWAGERVVESCTACHDPHAPGFPVRHPVTFAPPPQER